MFDIWHKIMEDGEAAIPQRPYYKDMWHECENKKMKGSLNCLGNIQR